MRDTRQSYMENGLGAGLEISEFQSFKVELDRSVERDNRRNGDVGGLVGESAKRRRRSSESEEGASEVRYFRLSHLSKVLPRRQRC